MLDEEDVIRWLSDGGDRDAVDVLFQCEFSYEYVDSVFRLDSGMEIEFYDLNIHAPRHILNGVSDNLKAIVKKIEQAISECVQGLEGIYIRNIFWVPRLQQPEDRPLDQEVHTILEALNSQQIKTLWTKALARRNNDPHGAITAAKTLLESVCKGILINANIKYPDNSDLPNLYRLVADRLDIAASQHVDKKLKEILGNIQAVVGGVAFIRNKMGDAHAHDDESTMPTPIHAELAVNLAGSMAMFLIKTWESRNTNII